MSAPFVARPRQTGSRPPAPAFCVGAPAFIRLRPVLAAWGRQRAGNLSRAGRAAPTRVFAPLDLMQLIAIALIWGVNNVFAKLAVDALPALMTVALRFLLVLVALFVWLRPPPSERRWI